ncbi:MAG: hypothetical protein DRP15_00075 [Candidatus Aenigmatarchaeota archaeon]|nr:MAG: hypothetical protein DRP15_00075 [Candidatus Aenigmarchaeota archaeon]
MRLPGIALVFVAMALLFPILGLIRMGYWTCLESYSDDVFNCPTFKNGRPVESCVVRAYAGCGIGKGCHVKNLDDGTYVGFINCPESGCQWTGDITVDAGETLAILELDYSYCGYPHNDYPCVSPSFCVIRYNYGETTTTTTTRPTTTTTTVPTTTTTTLPPTPQAQVTITFEQIIYAIARIFGLA